MRNRWMIIGAASVAAVIVLLVTILAGPEGVPTHQRLTTDQIAVIDVNPGFNPDARDSDTPQMTGPLLQEGGRGTLRMVDPDSKRVTSLQWDHLSPLPQGVYDMQQPITRIIFSPSRVIEVTADQGLFTFEEEQFQRGTLTGNVVVRLLETNDGSDVDFRSDRDLQMRMTLDKADFDMELGELNSKSPVRVTGPRIAFRGTGLNLNYNRLRNRIDRLVIDRNIDLWFNPQEDKPVAMAAATQSNGKVKPSDKPTSKTSTTATDTEEAEEHQPPQFYRARFEDDVLVEAAERNTTMKADYLTAVFTLDSRDNDEKPSKKKHEPATESSEQMPTPAPGSTPGNIPESVPGERGGVHITCAGQLIVEPHLKPDPDMLADTEAVLLALEGVKQPVLITTEEGETITAAQVDYLTTTGRVRAQAGGEAMPMRITSSEIGILTGKRFSIDPSTATGVVVGPGTLVTNADDQGNDALSIDWEHQLALTFYVDAAKNKQDKAGRIRAIRTATFHGHANAQHTDFAMTADILGIQLDHTDDDQQVLTGIDASGDVRLSAKDANDTQPVVIDTDTMRIEVTTDEDGREQPNRMIATGNVSAKQKGMILNTALLDARLGMVMQEDETEKQLAIEQMTAEQGVEIIADDPAVRLVGDHLQINAITQQMELFGTVKTPARAIREDGELTGMHLVMDERSETIHVVGPGVFTFQPPESPTKDGDNEEPETLTVTWVEAMHFDQKAGFTHFVGDVVSTADSLTDQTTLTCDDLRLDFEKLASEADDDTETQTGQLQIRTATARGNPVFKSRSFSVTDLETDLTRFRLEGPLMTFDNSPGRELVQIIGPGKMLIEDYRPPGTKDPGSPAPGSPAPETQKPTFSERGSPSLVQVSGRGQTLFVWQKQLTLDAARNDMLIEQQVQMVHRPTEGESNVVGEVVLLDCQKLFADMSDSKGMDGWLSDSSPKPNINMIVADRDVRIVQARKRAFCDRLIYDGSTNAIELLAASRNMVRIEDQDKPTPMTSKAFKWDLDTDEFNIMRPGAATVPLPR